MEIGNLRHRVKFLQPLKGRDAKTGAEVQTVIQGAEVWAHVEFKEVGSDERQEADQLTPMTSALFTVRYKSGITTQMEILHDGLKYKILSVLPDLKKCWLTLETVQVGAYREESLAELDGETLIDLSGNALVLGASDSDLNYVPPALTFTNDEDETFNPA